MCQNVPPVTSWHWLSAEEAAARLGVQPGEGPTRLEAAARQQQFGANELPTLGGRTLWGMVREQFRDIVIWVLLVAMVVSAASGELLDASVIIAIVILNAVLGVLQEWKAEQSLAALQRLSTPMAQVVRDGERVEVPVRDVVPGDLLLLEAGRYVPADARLIEAADLRLDESSLTGESLPVTKDPTVVLPAETPLAGRSNLVHMGTAVTHGRGRALAVATGTATELGQIAQMLGRIEAEKTPLQVRLEQLGRWLAVAVLLICGIVFCAGLLRGLPRLDLFLTAVSLAVAAILEGLPAVVTIVLAIGMQNMVRRHVIIRRLRAVEALGSTTVICTDKTGTLTENEMTVRRFLAGVSTGTVTGEGYQPQGEFVPDPTSLPPTPADLRILLEVAALCNDARLVQQDGTWRVVGDPTEGAFLVVAAKAGVWRHELETEMPRRAELPFDEVRKRMSTLHLRDSGRRVCVNPSLELIRRE
jgi:P-type Ca2+ transporter type 2C